MTQNHCCWKKEQFHVKVYKNVDAQNVVDKEIDAGIAKKSWMLSLYRKMKI